MKKVDKFFLVVLITVIIIRLVIFFIPENSFMFQDRYHHLYLGVLLLGVFAFYNYKLHHKLFYFFAIALGLIVDEIVFLLPLLVENVSKTSYLSWYSFLILLIGLVIVFLLRELIVKEVLTTQTEKIPKIKK